MKLIASLLLLAGMAAGQQSVAPVVGHDWQIVFGGQTNDPHEEWKVVDHLGYMRWWTCADTHRTLVRSEDGTRQCVLFNAPPRSVPAVRKTRKVCAEPLAATTVCLGIQCTVQCPEYKDEQYWDCADPDRALIVSQNGKKAACWLVDELQDSR